MSPGQCLPIQVGEETGDVPGALKNVADTYDSELTIALRVMMTLIEPILIIIMALGVGFLLLAHARPHVRVDGVGVAHGGLGHVVGPRAQQLGG